MNELDRLNKILAEIQAEIGNGCKVLYFVDECSFDLCVVWPNSFTVSQRFLPEVILQAKYDIIAAFIGDAKQAFDRLKAEESRHRVEELLKE